MKHLTPILAFLFLILMATSCVTEGPEGPQGEPGEDGNANVISTTITVSDWTTWGSGRYYTEVAIPEITQDIIDHGAVVVYMAEWEYWLALPFSWNPDNNVTLSYYYAIKAGMIDFEISRSDQASDDPGTKEFKIVIIGGSALAAHPDLNLDDYQAVKAEFGLTE